MELPALVVNLVKLHKLTNRRLDLGLDIAKHRDENHSHSLHGRPSPTTRWLEYWDGPSLEELETEYYEVCRKIDELEAELKTEGVDSLV